MDPKDGAAQQMPADIAGSQARFDGLNVAVKGEVRAGSRSRFLIGYARTSVLSSRGRASKLLHFLEILSCAPDLARFGAAMPDSDPADY